MFKITGWPQFLIFFKEITLLCNLSSFNMSRIYRCRFCIKKYAIVSLIFAGGLLLKTVVLAILFGFLVTMWAQM